MKQNDYCIIKVGAKPQMLKVSSVDKKHVHGNLELLSHISKVPVTCNLSDVLVTLGDEPFPGTVYGVNTSNILRGRKVHETFGDIYLFYKTPKDVRDALWKAFDNCYKLLEKSGLEFIVEGLVWEILPYNGEKYAGMYLKSRKENVPNRIQIRPEIISETELEYVILHELGHHLHASYVRHAKINANWIKLYNTSIKTVNIKKEMSQTILDNLVSQEDLPSSFKGQLDEDQALAFKWIIRTIQQLSGLSIKDLDTLFEADMKDEIKSVWPIRNIQHKDLAPVVSEYATKNFRELVAEAFSYYMLPKRRKVLPEPIIKLIERSISYGKTQRIK